MPQALDASMTSLLDALPEAAGDNIEVLHLQARGPGEAAEGISHAWDSLSLARVVIVDAARISLSRADAQALSRLATHGVRVVLASSTPLQGIAPLIALYEPCFARAVVASIYALPHEQAAVVISPEPHESPALRGLALHALRWRASWQDAEEGDLSSRPT
ncbi:MAG: hypothetical protein NTW19_22235 [Planctomycetota bacterium]|nr:hypothetical protein [Planctomycetota bacterium]